MALNHVGNTEEENNGNVVLKLNISTDQPGTTVGWGRGGCYSTRIHLFVQQASRQIFKDDVNGFSSTLDVSFMLYTDKFYDKI